MSLKRPIYLDYNATTPVDPRVLAAMAPYFTLDFRNPASESHVFGHTASAAVERARQHIAHLLGASPGEIVFTSGATESCNLALKGAAQAYARRGTHIITAMTEHPAVLEPCKRLQQEGFVVTWLQPDRYGRILPEQVAEAITDKTILVSIMAANNVIGTINPVAAIGRIAKERNVLFHCDATQAVGRLPLDVEDMGVDLLSLSAHKLYGPKGVGALYVRSRKPRVHVACQIHGGGQERDRRSGTLNVPGIVGLGTACEICGQAMADESKRMAILRDRLASGLLGALSHTTVNGHPTEPLCNTLNISFEFVDGEALMMNLTDVAVSSGSACASTAHASDYVLKAIGVGEDLAQGSIRFSLGRFTTEEEVDCAVERVVEAVRGVRQADPLYPPH